MPQERQRSSSSREKAYRGMRVPPRSFFEAPLCTDVRRLNADVAFLGVPYDQGGSRPGARFGPDSIRDAGRYVYRYCSDPWEEKKEAAGYFDLDLGGQQILEGVTFADCGNIDIVPAEVEKNFERLTRAVEAILDRGAFPVIVGGDHAITYPSVRAFKRFKPLDVVHFDAHQDFVYDYRGVLLSALTPIRRVSELPFVRHITSLGIRRARRREHEEALQRGVVTLTARQIRELGPRQAVARVPEADHVYVTIDMDVLNPMQAPGVSSPMPGGLIYDELREALTELSRRGRVAGLDIVEVAPAYDWAQNTAMVAARLIVDLLSQLFPPLGDRPRRLYR